MFGRVTFHITKRNLVSCAAIAALSVFARVAYGISLFNMAAFILLYFIVKNLEVEWKEAFQVFLAPAAIVLGSALTAWSMQYLLLVEDLRGRLSGQKFFLNICCVLVVYLAVQICMNRVGAACVVAHILLMAFAGVNFFVYEFRGNELTFADVRAFSTGLSVASSYRFSLNAQAMNVILLSALYAAAALKLQMKSRKAWRMRLACLSLASLSVVYVSRETVGTVTETWEQKGTYQNGYLLNFGLGIRDSFIKRPEGYSKEFIDGLEGKYKEGKGEAPSAKRENPVIIAIMNESFADLRTLGNLQTSEPVMPFFDSLSENAVKGYALASVYGSKTPNSEWEFLTGNSMAFLPSGSVAYQQYVEEENAYSLVDALKEEGYACVAMHPYYATGWSRDAIYPMLGFDEMYFLDEFDQSNLMRKYVPDETLYEKMIARFEAAGDEESLFLFGVTMQNHGGYRDAYDNFKTDVRGLNIRYADVNQYLSLARQSDLALEKLITYFSQVDRPVVICFFGDHQPGLNTGFYRKINGKGLSGLSLEELEELFMVPFFIWTNYESESQAVDCTSINYLSTMLLERSGIELPAYNRFLSDLMDAVPAINARAYYSKQYGKYVHFGDGPRDEEEWVEAYRNLQYNGMFDEKEKSKVFFGR